MRAMGLCACDRTAIVPHCQAQGETESQGRPAMHTGYMGLSQPWTLFNGPLLCGKQ